MIFDRILGNVYEDPAAEQRWREGDPPEEVALQWFECFRRAVRTKTASGRAVGLLPPLGTTLRHGDVIAQENSPAVVKITVGPCELLAVYPADLREMGLVAAELGNLHAAMEVRADGSLHVIPDGPVEAVLRRYAIRHERVTERFAPLRASVAEQLGLADGFQVVRRDGASASA